MHWPKGLARSTSPMRLWLPACLALLTPVSAADLAFVTSQNGNSVSVVDLDNGQIVAQTSVPDAPAPVAYDPLLARAYVISANSGRLSLIDETGAITATQELGEGAFGVAAIAGAGLLVTDWYGNRVMRLDRDLRTVWVSKTGRVPSGVAISDDGRLVATADRDDDQVSIFDAETGGLLHRIKTFGAHPFAVTFHDGKFWSADVLGDAISVIDPDDGRVLGHVATGKRPYGVAFVAGQGFVTNQYSSTVTVFDPGSLETISVIEVGDYPEGIAALPDNSGVALVNWDSDSLMVLDAETHSITAELDMPAGPRAFGQFTGRQARR